MDMFQFVEKGMRGVISYIANRYGKENEKCMKKYDEKASLTLYLPRSDCSSFTLTATHFHVNQMWEIGVRSR